MNARHKLYQVIVSILLVLIAALVVFITVSPAVGALVSELGTLMVMLGWLAWVIIFDSRKRWPGASVAQRADRVMTFKR